MVKVTESSTLRRTHALPHAGPSGTCGGASEIKDTAPIGSLCYAAQLAREVERLDDAPVLQHLPKAGSITVQ